MKPKQSFNAHFSNLMDALESWILPGYTTALYMCVSMPDMWCSFIAFVDCDVYFDDNIDDKQTGD